MWAEDVDILALVDEGGSSEKKSKPSHRSKSDRGPRKNSTDSRNNKDRKHNNRNKNRPDRNKGDKNRNDKAGKPDRSRSNKKTRDDQQQSSGGEKKRNNNRNRRRNHSKKKGKIIMAKLYFRYGTVGSAKTMNLLAVAHNYRHQNKKVLLLKPKIDTRFGHDVIKSRSGLIMEADLLIDDDTILDMDTLKGYHCLLVDEVQFLNASMIDQLRDISRKMNIPVICYGLRTDFRANLFEGSRRLFELCDAIEEVKRLVLTVIKKQFLTLSF